MQAGGTTNEANAEKCVPGCEKTYHVMV